MQRSDDRRQAGLIDELRRSGGRWAGHPWRLVLAIVAWPLVVLSATMVLALLIQPSA